MISCLRRLLNRKKKNSSWNYITFEQFCKTLSKNVDEHTAQTLYSVFQQGFEIGFEQALAMDELYYEQETK